MISSKMLTLSLTYKLKVNCSSDIACNEIESKLIESLNSSKFYSHMNIITKEQMIKLEEAQGNVVKFVITMFTSMLTTSVKDANKLFKTYIDDMLINLNLTCGTAKLTKRRFYC